MIKKEYHHKCISSEEYYKKYSTNRVSAVKFKVPLDIKELLEQYSLDNKISYNHILNISILNLIKNENKYLKYLNVINNQYDDNINDCDTIVIKLNLELKNIFNNFKKRNQWIKPLYIYVLALSMFLYEEGYLTFKED